jgi:FlaA1/EpsC-like NDP-sugar epimerase
VLFLHRNAKRLIALSVDISFCVLTVWLAFYLRLGELIYLNSQVFWATAISIAFAVPIFVLLGLYRAIFRYSGYLAMLTLTRAIGVYGLLFASVVTLIGFENIPRTIGLIQPLLLFFAVGGSRVLARYWLSGVYQNQLQAKTLPRALIYGAGSAGRQLMSAFENSSEMRIAGFLDDDNRLHGGVLNGQPIFSPNDLDNLIESKGITHVLIAIPSASRRWRHNIVKKISGHNLVVRALPSFTDLIDGRVTVSDLRDLDIDDLLGREVVDPIHSLLVKNISSKVVLVTGAGGSIGGELCRQIIRHKPQKLLLVEISEFALYTIHNELEELRERLGDFDTARITPLLASVQDEVRMREIINTWLPDTVYHAAAYKHVPLVEHNVAEGVKNNVIGTLITAQIAIEKGVSNFVLISTDKAVRPTNVMGASKRLAEICLQALHGLQAQQSANKCCSTGADHNPTSLTNTNLSMVRFGNVLDSSGSVLPKFQKQIRNGGPITLTHPEITRYFMTIPEAAQLVIQAGAMATGGDVFLLDMGEKVKIADLARRMIELSGLSVRDDSNSDGDIEIEVTGLRPGDKLYEELLIGDNPQPTDHPKIMKALEEFLPWAELQIELEKLNLALQASDALLIRSALKKLVPGYQPNGI